MIENTVKDYPDTVFVQLIADIAEGVVIAETTVNSFIVYRIVTVLD